MKAYYYNNSLLDIDQNKSKSIYNPRYTPQKQSNILYYKYSWSL